MPFKKKAESLDPASFKTFSDTTKTLPSLCSCAILFKIKKFSYYYFCKKLSRSFHKEPYSLRTTSFLQNKDKGYSHAFLLIITHYR
jgi:hypothetical protein